MKTILWGNYKGGVGKTTSVFQVATYFAEAGKKCCWLIWTHNVRLVIFVAIVIVVR